jgi:glycopeptide antibiotics resistance protein
MLKKPILCGAAILLLAGLFYLSLNQARRNGGTIAHRVDHIGAFGALALLLLPLARNRRETWLITAASLCVACGMELLQYHVFHFASNRQPIEWWDIRDNTVGILLALLAVQFTRLRT